MLKNFPQYKAFVPKNLQDKWESNLWKSLVVLALSYPVMLIAALFVRTELRIDTMKRRAKDRGDPEYTQYEALRDYLPYLFNWFQTHDNAMDEYWYGGYEDFINDKCTQVTYDNSWLLRYYNRVRWGWRNASYGYRYYNLGVPEESEIVKSYEEGFEDGGSLWIRIDVYKNYFLYESQVPDGKGTYKTYKFGHKAHRSAPLINGTKNVMYASRYKTLSTRKYK